MAEKHFLLTGATGFVGSHLVCQFLKLGFHLRLLVRGNPDTAQEKIKQVLLNSFSEREVEEFLHTKIEIFEGDITQRSLGMNSDDYARFLKGVDEVWHCAACVKFDEKNRGELEEKNLIGTENMLILARDLNPKCFHYISTAYVAGKREGLIKEDELDHEKGFKNSYEETKFKAEKLVREYEGKHKIKVTIYRPSIIVGDSKTFKTMNFNGMYGAARVLDLIVKTFELKSQVYSSNGPIRILASKDANLNLVPIDYVVNAMMTISGREDSLGKTFHIVNPSPPRTAEVWEGAAEAIGVKAEVVNFEAFQKGPMTLQERIFTKNVKPYLPYHFDHFFFDDTNTRNALKGSSIKCPLVTKELVVKFINYCCEVNWGKTQ